MIYGSNALYYFYTIAILMSPLYLLTLALSNHPMSWAFTLYFIPSLVVKFAIEPFVMRRELAPLATTVVVISNAYTFLQALVLLVIKRPLGWEATGTTVSKKSAHFTYFKLFATASFITMYLLTLGALIMNERFAVGPSMFVVCLFLTSLLAHIWFLFYTLIATSKARYRITDRKFYAAIMLVLITGVVVFGTFKYHSAYDVEIVNNHIILAKQDDSLKTTDTPLDGYRRSLGDVKQILHIQ